MMLVLLEIEVQTFYDGCCLDFFFVTQLMAVTGISLKSYFQIYHSDSSTKLL